MDFTLRDPDSRASQRDCCHGLTFHPGGRGEGVGRDLIRFGHASENGIPFGSEVLSPRAC